MDRSLPASLHHPPHASANTEIPSPLVRRATIPPAGDTGERSRMDEPVRVLILGGGFGGVAVAQELEKLLPKLDRPVEVTLVSQSNYLLFVPMLPSAAAASVDLTHILCPLREILHR